MDLEKLVKSTLPGGFAQTYYWHWPHEKRHFRVVLLESSGNIILTYGALRNTLQGNPLWLHYVKTPVLTLGYEGSYEVFVKAHVGGLSWQAEAISLGIARALLKVIASHRLPLEQEGFLTWDSRVFERKKLGLRQVKKHPQCSKC